MTIEKVSNLKAGEVVYVSGAAHMVHSPVEKTDTEIALVDHTGRVRRFSIEKWADQFSPTAPAPKNKYYAYMIKKRLLVPSHKKGHVIEVDAHGGLEIVYYPHNGAQPYPSIRIPDMDIEI